MKNSIKKPKEGMILSPYKIAWAVEVMPNGKTYFNHFFNKKNLKENFTPKRGARVYVITDKQFGLIQNTYDGSIPVLKKPFSYSELVRDGFKTSLIPITEKQFKNIING